MARCINHECGFHNEAVVEFMDGVCPQCNFEQRSCPRCNSPSSFGLVCDSCTPFVKETEDYAHYFDDILSYILHGDRKGTPNHTFEAIIKFVESDMGAYGWKIKHTKQ